MTGQELKEILSKHGVQLNKLASELGILQPALSQMFKVQDVKSGFLENICDIFNADFNFFYSGTKYDPILQDAAREMKISKINALRQCSDVQKEFDELLKKYYILQGKYESLKEAYELVIKSKMEQGNKAVGE